MEVVLLKYIKKGEPLIVGKKYNGKLRSCK